MRTVRLRLTLLYGALFLVSGAALLGITYVLVRHNTNLVLIHSSQPGEQRRIETDDPERLQNLVPARLRADANRERNRHDLLVQSSLALGLMSMLSIGLGWVMAGRVLRPLRTMTATTRRISAHNLHERLALEGPSDELKNLGDTIDDLLERLEAAFGAQRRFVANASHELRTPLAMMRTSLDVAAAKPGPRAPELEALERKLREGLDRADRLLESFLALARAQHGGALPEVSTVSLAEVAGTALAIRRDAIAERGIEVRERLGDAAVGGSRPLLARMVDNVVDNAIRHNEAGGWIGVETGQNGDRASVVVESGGPRLDEAEVQELVQPFRRLGAERTGGVGLGLSIVAAIADAHGGELALEARPEGGLRVAIALPRVPR
jgi:signal transduction histidine kinase